MRYILFCVLLSSSYALAADRTAVMKLLGGYEWHVDARAFGGLDPDAYKTLIAIASDEQEANLVRGRAIAALTLFPNDEVWDYLHAGISGTTATIRRRRMVDALCDTFAGSRSASVEGAVEPLLGAADAHLRIRAARCLSKLGGPAAQAALANYKAAITQQWEVQAAFPGRQQP